MDNDIILEFENVSYSYEDTEETDAVYAVENISFKIKRGEFVTVLGSNGSGKSTIAKLSNSIYIPTSGRVLVEGNDTASAENEYEARKKVGVVFQNPDNQIVASIVEEDVAFGPENLGLEPELIRQRVDEALKVTGMYDYRMHETHRLSGGQKQRVAIAGILAMHPDCIVLDEPTAMLDPKGRESVIGLIRKLNSESGVTVVLITHFMDEAAYSDRTLVVNKSHLVADSTPAELFKDTALLKECGLSLPETVELKELLRKKGVNINESIIFPEDFVRAFVKLSERSR